MAKSTTKRSYRKHRKTRRNRRQTGGTNASNTVSKKPVAAKSHSAITKIHTPLDKIYMTLPEIRRTIETTNKEYCGYIDRVGNYVLTDIGPEKTETSRGTCNQVKAPIIWHTHSSASKYYPSAEDINKVLKHPEINSSTIYTQYGYWTLDYIGERILTTDEIQVINDILRQFYNNTTKGREYNSDAINNLVNSINAAIDAEFISWTDKKYK
jgi:hypothetical protein